MNATVLLAVHLSDGVLTWPAWTGGVPVAAALIALGAWRIRDEEIPRIALLTAAFFIASLIHLKVGPTSVHLVLNGLVGVMLGRRALLAIPIGLALQLFLLGHGGFQTLGVNTVVIAAPAVLAGGFFHSTRPTKSATGNGRRRSGAVLWRPALAGFAAGAGALLLTAALNALVLVLAGVEDWRIVAAGVFAAHLPLALIEGCVTGFAAAFLMKVQPALLGMEPAASAVAFHPNVNGSADRKVMATPLDAASKLPTENSHRDAH